MSSTNKLYNGAVTLNFSEKARNRYTIAETGDSPVGVTTVLGMLNKPALMTWPMNEALKYLEQHPGDLAGAATAYLKKGDTAKDVGTEVHAAVENFLLGKASLIAGQYTPEAERALWAFKAWHDASQPKALAVEKVVYSRKHNYAGTLDSILNIGGEIVLCDIKTTNSSRSAPLGIYSEYFLQLGAYNLAWREEKATRVKRISRSHNYSDEYPTDLMVIRVGKDGVVNTLRASQIGLTVRECEEKFLDVLSLYKKLTPLNKLISERIL